MSFRCHMCNRTFPCMLNDDVDIVCDDCLPGGIVRAVVEPHYRDMDVNTVIVNVLKETCIDKIELSISVGETVNILDRRVRS